MPAHSFLESSIKLNHVAVNSGVANNGLLTASGHNGLRGSAWGGRGGNVLGDGAFGDSGLASLSARKGILLFISEIRNGALSSVSVKGLNGSLEVA